MKQLIIALAVSGTFAVTAAELPVPQRDRAQMGGRTAPAAVKATGVVKSKDAAIGRIVISHDPIPALKWPTMVMSFKISAELAKGLKAGQKVEFEFLPADMDGTITKVRLLPR